MNMDRRTVIAAGAALAVAPLARAEAAVRGTRSFPRGFLWGAATAGHQVEGNNVNSDVWVMENVKPTVYSEPSGDADNSFELWPTDLDLVKRLGLNTYRFSLEWARIEPEPGLFSIAMLDHYKAMIAGCRQRGLMPMVTFNHYTLPKWLAARGGWTNAETPDLFARFCDRAARHMADGMAYATTLNEPNVGRVIRNALPPQVLAGLMQLAEASSRAAAKAVGSDRFVPGYTVNIDDFDALFRTMISGHRKGRSAIKAARGDLPVGVSLAMPDDQAAGPDSIRDRVRQQSYGAWLEAAREDDFLGVQNYDRTVWSATGTIEDKNGPGDKNAAGGTIYPDSLANAVRYAHSVAKVPIIVTEHGVNATDDAVRARFIPAALAELKKAMDEGVPVKGYLHWSLLDNFEWIFAYKNKYGLVAVDRKTFARTPKPSAAVLGSIARRNSL